jgi:hypothetical protein
LSAIRGQTGEVAKNLLMQRAEKLPILASDDLAKKLPPMDWLIRNFWPLGSHGPIAGAKKTLKSYIALAGALAVSSGIEMLGNPVWKVPYPGPVIVLSGEGGEYLVRSRLQRISRDVYGMKLRSLSRLPLVVLPSSPKFGTDQFVGYLLRALDIFSEPPALIIIDSVYNYHPTSKEVQVSNVYDRGPMLSEVSDTAYRWCGQEVVLWLIDHFKSTGNGSLDLDSIAQAGMAEFADTWMLLKHREKPDPDNGLFKLRAEIGSRQPWPGAGWEIDWDIGRYDEDANDWAGSISVEANRCERAVTTPGKHKVTDSDITAAVLTYVEEHPWAKTKDQICHDVARDTGTGDKRVRAAFGDLAEKNLLLSEKRKREEGGTEKMRELWAPGDGKYHAGVNSGR